MHVQSAVVDKEAEVNQESALRDVWCVVLASEPVVMLVDGSDRTTFRYQVWASELISP